MPEFTQAKIPCKPSNTDVRATPKGMFMFCVSMMMLYTLSPEGWYSKDKIS